MRESDGVSRIIAHASHAPSSGPFQDGNLFAFTVRKNALVIVDVTKEEVVLEKTFPEMCILHGLKNGYVFYYLGSHPQTMVFSIATKKEKAYPGNLVLVTEGGFLVTNDRGILRIFAPTTEECLFSEPVASAEAVLSLGEVVFVPTRDTQRNCSGYLGFDIASRKTFPVPSLSPDTHFHLPEYHGHPGRAGILFRVGSFPSSGKKGKQFSLNSSTRLEKL
ncbi:MAG: hypothetical protein ABDK94_00450 [Atribacterota bacterium]